MQSISWETLDWMKHKLDTRFPREISITSDTQMTPPLWQKVKKNQRASWWKWKKGEKVGLKLNIQKAKIMTSGPITSWQIDGETVETMTDFIFLCSKITVDGDCSHEIKRHLLLGRKVMTNLDSILKSKDITLPTKFGLVKAMVFPVVIYGYWMEWHHQLDRHEFEQLQVLVMERGAGCARVHGVAKSWTRLSDWTDESLQMESLV